MAITGGLAMLITRRHVVITGTAATLAAIAGAARAAVPTSGQEMGPFYPIQHLADEDADLTRVRGLSGVAKGMPMNVVARVLDMKGNPVRGAHIEIWQANDGGRYRHPGDIGNKIPIDPNFQGYAVLRSDGEGQFRFRTIRPGLYGDRTRHIHFDVRSANEQLITQMYFPGEPRNATDGLFQGADDKSTLLARPIEPLSRDPSALAFAWDITLENG